MQTFSFIDRIIWKEGQPILPRLSDAEIEEVLKEFRPTPENLCCECAGEWLCSPCVLTKVIDQLRRRD